MRIAETAAKNLGSCNPAKSDRAKVRIDSPVSGQRFAGMQRRRWYRRESWQVIACAAAVAFVLIRQGVVVKCLQFSHGAGGRFRPRPTVDGRFLLQDDDFHRRPKYGFISGRCSVSESSVLRIGWRSCMVPPKGAMTLTNSVLTSPTKASSTGWIIRTARAAQQGFPRLWPSLDPPAFIRFNRNNIQPFLQNR